MEWISPLIPDLGIGFLIIGTITPEQIEKSITDDINAAAQQPSNIHAFVVDPNGLPLPLAGVDTIQSCFLSFLKCFAPECLGKQLCSRLIFVIAPGKDDHHA